VLPPSQLAVESILAGTDADAALELPLRDGSQRVAAGFPVREVRQAYAALGRAAGQR
jgi:hypothetical protein